MNSFENYNVVKSYWLSLFPELKTISDLDDLLWQTSKKRISDLEFRAGCSDEQQNLIQLILTKYNNKENKKEKVLNIYREKFQNTYFYYFYEPIIDYYFDSFYEKLCKFDFIEDISSFVEVIIFASLNLLGKIGIRTLVLETNIARISRRLEGETSEERFWFYNKSLLRDSEYLKELYTAYPTLIDLLCLKTRQLYDYILEIMINIENDWDEIVAEFSMYSPQKRVKMILAGLGDEHKNGKTVAQVLFKNDFKLIYKPRNVSIEKGFNNLIRWIHEENIQYFMNLKIPGIVSKNNHGWIEYVEYKECNDIKEVSAFYTRMGELLSLLYALDAVDFHHENLIAHGMHPILIDLETLFHPKIKEYEHYSSESRKLAQKIIDESVLSVGFLPYFQISERDFENHPYRSLYTNQGEGLL